MAQSMSTNIIIADVFISACVFIMEKHKVPTKYITLIKDMYKDAMTFVRTCDGNITDFPINIGLHQGSALSPYLFALVLDEVTICSLLMMWC